MEATREEARFLLERWLAESTLLECRMACPSFAASITGRLVGIGDETILRSDLGDSELRFLWSSALAFVFRDPSTDPAGARVPERFGETLVAVLRFDDRGNNDFISLTHIVPGTR